MLMITPEDVQRNIPKAMRWVTQSEQACMETGQQLSPQRKRDAQAIGVQQIGVVRIMLSNEIPLPDDPELRQLVLQSGLGSSRGITFGHGIVLKPGAYDRHLIAHELAHVMQYERLVELNRSWWLTYPRSFSLLTIRMGHWSRRQSGWPIPVCPNPA